MVTWHMGRDAHMVRCGNTVWYSHTIRYGIRHIIEKRAYIHFLGVYDRIIRYGNIWRLHMNAMSMTSRYMAVERPYICVPSFITHHWPSSAPSRHDSHMMQQHDCAIQAIRCWRRTHFHCVAWSIQQQTNGGGSIPHMSQLQRTMRPRAEGRVKLHWSHTEAAPQPQRPSWYSQPLL